MSVGSTGYGVAGTPGIELSTHEGRGQIWRYRYMLRRAVCRLLARICMFPWLTEQQRLSKSKENNNKNFCMENE